MNGHKCTFYDIIRVAALWSNRTCLANPGRRQNYGLVLVVPPLARRQEVDYEKVRKMAQFESRSKSNSHHVVDCSINYGIFLKL